MALSDRFFGAYLFFIVFAGWSLLCWFASTYVANEEAVLRTRTVRRSPSFGKRRQVFLIQKWGLGLVVVIVTAAGIMWTRNQDTNYELTQMTGVLIPADDPTPSNGCLNPKRKWDLPANSVVLMLGNRHNGVFTTHFPQIVVAYNSHPVLSLDKGIDGNMAISVTIFDKNGDLIASIDKNNFNVANHALQTHKPRPDKSTLVVYDESGHEVLYVRYLNRSTIKITGSMWLGGKDYPIDLPAENSCMDGFHIIEDIGGPPEDLP